MGVQGQFYVGLDMNRDHYFPRGVVEGDALNLIDNPQQLDLRKFAGTESALTYTRQVYEYDYNYSYFVQPGTNVFGGFELGNTALSENGIWVTSGTAHSARIEVKGEAGYSGKSIGINIRDYGTNALVGFAFITLTGAWQTLTATFTPGASRVYLRVIKNNDAADYSWSTRKVMVVEGTMPTAYNSGSASDYYEDISTYVHSMSWNNGMDHYDQTVSGGSQATITLDNLDGLFYQDDEIVAPEITEQFDSWASASQPQGWSVLSIVDANNITSEVGSDNLHGEGGTEALNIYATTKVLVGIKSVLGVPNGRYKVEFSIGASSGLGGVRFGLETPSGNITYVSRIYTEPGVYTFFFTLASSGLGDTFCITNNRYPCDITLEYVIVTPMPRFAGMLKETLISIQGGDPGTEVAQLWTGRVTNIVPSGGSLAVRTVTLECVDAMAEFNNLEYRPDVAYEGTTPATEMVLMFDRLPLLWPYAKDYWFLGTSVLGVDTWLHGGTDIDTFGTGTFTIDYAAAGASNSEKGISAQAFARDLMALEIGGRFYIEARSGEFKLFTHDYDPSYIDNTSAITDDDFDSFELAYAEDVLNTINIWYKQKRLGSGNVVLWSTDQPITVPGKSTKNITGRYFDPTNAEIQVSAVSTEAFVRNVDYIISPAPNNAKVQVTADAGGTSATFTIDNDRQIDITVTTLQIRGFPLYALTEESTSVQNPDSVFDNNIQQRDYNMPLISDGDVATAIATGLTTMRGEPFNRLQSITWSATKSNDRYVRALYLPSGEIRPHYTITASTLKLLSGYVIIGEKHSVAAGGELTWMVTWVLAPKKLINYWILGEVGRSELGINTIPIY